MAPATSTGWQNRLALKGRPRARVVGITIGSGARRVRMRLRIRRLGALGGLTSGKIFGQATSRFVAVLIQGHEELALTASKLLVERTDNAAADPLGFTAQADVVGAPRGGRLKDQAVFASAFQQVAGIRFDFEEQSAAPIERATGGDRFQRRQQLVFHARLLRLTDAGAW